MPRQTPGNYVPLDVNYARKRRIRQAGEAAELLYIRSLAYAKGAKTDGNVPDFDLEVVAVGLRNVSKRVTSLVAVGLWTEVEDGWFITDWWDWNGSTEDDAAFTEHQSDKGILGNHKRWHVAKGIANPDCPLCHPATPQPDRSSDRQPDRAPESPIREGKGREGKEAMPTASRFAEFWTAYPIKKDRANAEKAYDKQIKAGASHDQIMAGLATYTRLLSLPGAPSPKYAQGWLNGKRWEDEDDPANSGRTNGRNEPLPPAYEEAPMREPTW